MIRRLQTIYFANQAKSFGGGFLISITIWRRNVVKRFLVLQKCLTRWLVLWFGSIVLHYLYPPAKEDRNNNFNFHECFSYDQTIVYLQMKVMKSNIFLCTLYTHLYIYNIYWCIFLVKSFLFVHGLYRSLQLFVVNVSLLISYDVKMKMHNTSDSWENNYNFHHKPW